jgi:hypothetical protein
VLIAELEKFEFPDKMFLRRPNHWLGYLHRSMQLKRYRNIRIRIEFDDKPSIYRPYPMDMGIGITKRPIVFFSNPE